MKFQTFFLSFSISFLELSVEKSDWSWTDSLHPGQLWGAKQQWWRHRYGRWRGRRMPRVLVPHATRYGPS